MQSSREDAVSRLLPRCHRQLASAQRFFEGDIMIRRVILALACVLLLGSSFTPTSQAQEPAYRAYSRHDIESMFDLGA